MEMPQIIAHGGAGSKPELKEHIIPAIEEAYMVLRSGGDALEAAMRGTMVLEDDPVFNAGTGSVMSLDGSIEMDASLMTSEGRIGGVISIRDVKNPIAVARKVMDTPHIMLSSEGAVKFARNMGFQQYNPSTPKAIKRMEEVKEALCTGEVKPYAQMWLAYDIPEYYKKILGCDTVGMVVRDDRGFIAVANSTGGISYKLPGRVGDSPQIGSGFWAGEGGGVVATGIGEEIARRLTSYRVYEKFTTGEMSISEAMEWGISLFDESTPVGIIGVDSRGKYGVAANTEMAYATLDDLEET